MPPLVAASPPLVGLAAVLVAAGALYAPQAFGIGAEGAIHGGSLFEMGLGAALGAGALPGPGVRVPPRAPSPPQAFGIGAEGAIHGGSLFEMALGAAIGAVTFTGSVIAFLKLDGRMSGKPIMLPSRHLINIGLALLLLVLLVLFIRTESHAAFWLIVLVSFVLGVALLIPNTGRR